MSRSEAKEIAERIYVELVEAGHRPGFIRMIIRDLERTLNRDEKNKARIPPGDAQAPPAR